MNTDPLAPTGYGHTDLGVDDRQGLLLSHISSRSELNDAELRNIAEATLRRPPSEMELLEERYLRALHLAMFGKVWAWAGKYRLRETNLGIEPARISTSVRSLLEDLRAWREFGTFDADEICVRFHHRLVAIRPFHNDNGRHSRIAADYLAMALGRPRFGWGIGLNLATGELRETYLTALRRADQHELTDLLNFARS